MRDSYKFAAAFLLAAASVGCEAPAVQEPEGKSALERSEAFGSTRPEVRVSGPQFARGHGWSIIWSTEDTNAGAQPREVLDALIHRMEAIQQTPQGGDQTARVIWSLHEARDLMDGTDPFTQKPLGNTEGEE